MSQQPGPNGHQEHVYYESINPLVQQISKIATSHALPFVLLFQTDDGQYILTHYTPQGSAEELHMLVKWVQEH